MRGESGGKQNGEGCTGVSRGSALAGGRDVCSTRGSIAAPQAPEEKRSISLPYSPRPTSAAHSPTAPPCHSFHRTHTHRVYRLSVTPSPPTLVHPPSFFKKDAPPPTCMPMRAAWPDGRIQPRARSPPGSGAAAAAGDGARRRRARGRRSPRNPTWQRGGREGEGGGNVGWGWEQGRWLGR
jgi:hypothetical protein